MSVNVMATGALQMLNLSPIPELSEMELSTILEHLNSVSDLNGEVTNHNMEDILREAEELIDMSTSIKTDSIDSHKCENNGVNERTGNAYKENVKSTDTKLDDSETINEMLNLSLSSDDNNQKNLKSESLKSNLSESNSYQTESFSPTPRSITNHIQSTLDSLRECSKKIENQAKTSSQNTKEDLGINPQKRNENPDDSGSVKGKISGESQIIKRGSNFGEENVLESAENLKEVLKKNPEVPTCLKLIERKKSTKKTVKGLSLDESLQTLNCFERLYMGRPAKDKGKDRDIKRWRTTERITNHKKAVKIGEKNNDTLKFETLKKDRKLRGDVIPDRGNEQHCRDKKENLMKENLTDEEISFEKCLSLLQEESDHGNPVDLTSFNYLDFTENIFKNWAKTMSAVQNEVEDLKSQLRRNATKNPYSNTDSNLADKFSSQENLIHKLKEENMKLFKEVEEIKGQLKMGGAVLSNRGADKSNEYSKKFQTVDALREELRNISQSLTSYSEANGIIRLEEQFSSLKAKYDQQIGKLEDENRKLKELLASQSPHSVSARKHQVTKSELGVQTERPYDDINGIIEFDVDLLPRKDPNRSKSGEVHENSAYFPFARSFKTVDVATSPIKCASSKTDKELCSVSVQCRGELDLCDLTAATAEDSRAKMNVPKSFNKLENKENISNNKKACVKTRLTLNSGNQMLNLLKQKKMSEHENQLMVTVRALHSEITVKDRDNKKMKNELEVLKNQIKRMSSDLAKHKGDLGKKCHVGTQTIALTLKMQEAYDPLIFQVSRELEEENEELKGKINELEKVINLLKDKRINDLQILQKIHEEEIDKLASRLKSQTALTNHLHSLLTSR